ncbi:MAG: cbb3-type cytochrome oxidase subunit 3 [Geminicoccaceae bacterium]
MDYESLRQFADTWGLVFLIIVFLAVVLFVFRPGAKRKYEENAKIPFRED